MNKNFTEEQLKAQLKKYGRSTISESELNKAEKMSSLLGEQIDNFKMILDMVKDHFKGNYQIDMSALVMLIAAIIYVISPIDLIPDFTPVIGYLDDIGAIGIAMAMCGGAIKGYLAWKSVQVVVDGAFSGFIEYAVTKQISKINDFINSQYANLGRQLLIEVGVLGCFIAVKYFYPTLLIGWVVFAYAVGRGSWSAFKIWKSTDALLLQLNFYEVSQFFAYFKMTKNFHQALVLDMRNFYDYHYKKSLNPDMQLLHQIGVAVELTPDNEAIFDRICKSIFENVPIMLKREGAIFGVFFVLYMIVIFILRQIAIGWV